MKILIGIAGPKRSGKDTLAAGLCQALGLQQFSYADPIRNAVCEILGITRAELELCKETPIDWLNGVTPRHMMQTLGTEWGREHIHPFLWGLSMFRRMPDIGGVTSDVRFDNEAKALLDQGGIIIRLSRPGLVLDDAHPSEVPISDELVTVDLVNDSTPERLIQKAIACLR